MTSINIDETTLAPQFRGLGLIDLQRIVLPVDGPTSGTHNPQPMFMAGMLTRIDSHQCHLHKFR